MKTDPMSDDAAALLDVLVVGGGVFGATGALTLARRGHRVRLIDPGPLPHPLAASTDRSKVVRADYGDDPVYTAMGLDALAGWRRWNMRWAEAHGGPVYHEDGFLLRTRGPMSPESFEGQSYAASKARGLPVERIDAAELARRHPQWRADVYPDGYLNPQAGWADAEGAMKQLHREVKAAGVEVLTDEAGIALLEEGGRVVGVLTAEAQTLRADVTVVAIGSWTTALVPELTPMMRATGHPNLLFRVDDAAAWRPPHFGPWAADIARTGWYGFPAKADGTIKVARHAAGVPLPHGAPRTVSDATIAEARAFLADTLPALAEAPLVATRLCAYCDTFDGHFWIDRDPTRPGLVVAAGGSGHAFKFAPVLGDRIAAAVEGRRDAIEPRFRWRSPNGPIAAGRDAARAS